ncbi:Transglutaminase-like superfamily protein [Paenibacillus sp. 1_12]|uniref:transglutaminase-like domain-containing protein n=1 Tax=Paenibacillus sp. 1_12 TaxID=1566278 RepID=UPI0008E13DEF|nr:transglutaminase family protein [Paenibacillus sp. 1_12]SFL57460.1 Transglutaminase-like superfamily protein [Paenibacillus sp. 1_12]
MNLTCESDCLEDYLVETEVIDFGHSTISKKSSELYAESINENDFIKNAYEYVRDEIAHSWDIQSSRVTCKASEALIYQEGICYAKSNLLCALLRSKGIPAGFCYQRLTIGDTPDTGYCIHALNATYMKSIGRWVRLDARGNKVGIAAEFSVSEEKLAFPVRQAYNEMDYSVIYKAPNAKTIEVLKQNSDCIHMYLNGLPSTL